MKAYTPTLTNSTMAQSHKLPHAGYYSNTSSSMLVTRPIRGSRRGRPRGSRRGGLTRASTTANTITVNLTNSDLGLGEYF
uniref:Uncharacterized protein n=1 Tax=Timema tahoe TaxID=61484 RepID=A0A7R9ICZ6_9NEOP|nr:unnamed protein product [Timema tahoe]